MTQTDEKKKTNWTLLAIAGFVTGIIGALGYFYWKGTQTVMPGITTTETKKNDAGGAYTPYIPGMVSAGCGCMECAEKEKRNATGKTNSSGSVKRTDVIWA